MFFSSSDFKEFRSNLSGFRRPRMFLSIFFLLIEAVLLYFLISYVPPMYITIATMLLSCSLYAINRNYLSVSILFFWQSAKDLNKVNYRRGRAHQGMAAAMDMYYQWLNTCSPKWGLQRTSDASPSMATTCMGLLALKSSGTCNRSDEYQVRLEEVMQEVKSKGAQSYLIGEETVICTSLILILGSWECRTNEQFKTTYGPTLQSIADRLWATRGRDRSAADQTRYGWGVFVENDPPATYVTATFWALLALSSFPVASTPEFISFLQNIYSYSIHSRFGYTLSSSSSPSLTATAMALSLYYKVGCPASLTSYDPKAAASYIMDEFCTNHTEYELENMRIYNEQITKIRDNVWTHIPVEFVCSGIISAYHHNDISRMRYLSFLNSMLGIIKDTESYTPSHFQSFTKEECTFPTACMLWALGHFFDEDYQ